jgi:hypothetical protein
MSKTEKLNKRMLELLPTDTDRMFICELMNNGWTFDAHEWMDQRAEDYLDVMFKSPRMKRASLMDSYSWKHFTRQKLWDKELDAVASTLTDEFRNLCFDEIVHDFIRGELHRFESHQRPQIYSSTQIAAAIDGRMLKLQLKVE